MFWVLEKWNSELKYKTQQTFGHDFGWESLYFIDTGLLYRIGLPMLPKIRTYFAKSLLLSESLKREIIIILCFMLYDLDWHVQLGCHTYISAIVHYGCLLVFIIVLIDLLEILNKTPPSVHEYSHSILGDISYQLILMYLFHFWFTCPFLSLNWCMWLVKTTGSRDWIPHLPGNHALETNFLSINTHQSHSPLSHLPVFFTEPEYVTCQDYLTQGLNTQLS